MKTSFKTALLTITLTTLFISDATSFIIQKSQTVLPTNRKIQIQGAHIGDSFGQSVGGVGDVNGDGFDDIICSSPYSNASSGTVYVLFGSENGLFEVNLSNLTSTQGFIIDGASVDDNLGSSVSGAGDINGDGIDDIIIGDSSASPFGRLEGGTAYVIFGSRHGLPDIDVKNITSSQGFKIFGAYQEGWLGISGGRAGDINKDGIDDLIVGSNNGAYVILGNYRNFSDIDLQNFDNTQGFRLFSANARDAFGLAVSGAGDINGDGIDDIVVGAPLTSTGVLDGNGAAYVLFGSRNRFSDINVNNLTPTQGGKITGVNTQDSVGISVHGAGDVNGDGIDDIIIGGSWASPLSRDAAGIAYVLFGNWRGFSDVDLKNLTNAEGFRIMGAVTGDCLGTSVSGAGDVNGDGIDDLIVGAPSAFKSVGDDIGAGGAYVIYGSRDGLSDIDVGNLSSSQGMVITGDHPADQLGVSVRSAGDVNGDGVSDLIIGAPGTVGKGLNAIGLVEIILGDSSSKDLIIL